MKETLKSKTIIDGVFHGFSVNESDTKPEHLEVSPLGRLANWIDEQIENGDKSDPQTKFLEHLKKDIESFRDGTFEDEGVKDNKRYIFAHNGVKITFDHTSGRIYEGEIDEFNCSNNTIRAELSPGEGDFLKALLMNRGQIISKEEIWETINPDEIFLPHSKNSVEAQKRRTCKRLEEAELPGHIKTLWGRGYVFFDYPEEPYKE